MKTKPPYFEVVGWSWFAMGLLGMVTSLLSCLSLPLIDRIRNYLLAQQNMILGESIDMLLRILNLIIPMIIIQLGLSAVMTYGAWLFIKGQKWGRLGLMSLNYAMVGLGLWSYGAVILTVGGAIQNWKSQGLLPTHVTAPSLWDPVMLLILILLLAPMIVMAWYFHWKPVRLYFQ